MSLLLEKLQKYGERLLDLSLRNQLLKTRFNSNIIRVIDELPDQLFKALRSGEKMYLKPLPDPADDPADEKTIRFTETLEIFRSTNEEYLKAIEKIEADDVEDIQQASETALRRLKDAVREELQLPARKFSSPQIKDHAISLGLNPDYEMPVLELDETIESKWTDNLIQTLILPDTLRRKMNSLNSSHQSLRKETGINPLFICFGYLEWRESSFSSQILHAPLLLLQTEFIDAEKRTERLTFKATGDELQINTTLSERLKRDFEYTLPELSDPEGDDSQPSIEEYWHKISTEIEKFPQWKVRRYICIGCYNSQNIPIYKDLENIPHSSISDLVTNMLEGRKDPNSSLLSEVYDVDAIERDRNLPNLIEPADSSQYSAVVDVLEGKNLVIKGPPGTGKSQTITNIISALISEGKSVLFVAQKQAALDVVKNNLKKNGLEDFVLDVFSSKSNKQSIFNSIADRVKLKRAPISSEYDEALDKYRQIKRRLNRYQEIISQKYGNTGKTLHDVIWDIPELSKSTPVSRKLLDFNFGEVDKLSEQRLDNLLSELDHFARQSIKINDEIQIDGTVLERINKVVSNPIDLEDIQSEIESQLSNLEEIESLTELFHSNNSFFSDITQKPYIAFDSLQKIEQLAREDNSLFELLLDANIQEVNLPKYKEVICRREKIVSDQVGLKALEGWEKDADLRYRIGPFDEYLSTDWIVRATDYSLRKEKFDQLVLSVEEKFDVSTMLYDTAELKLAAKELKLTSFFSFLSADWRRAKAIFKDLSKSTPNRDYVEMGAELVSLVEYSFEKISEKEKLSKISAQLNRELVAAKELVNSRFVAVENEIDQIEADLISTFSDPACLSHIRKLLDNAEQYSYLGEIRKLSREFKLGWALNPEVIAQYVSLTDRQDNFTQKSLGILSSFGITLSYPQQAKTAQYEECCTILRSLSQNSKNLTAYMQYLKTVKSLENGSVGEFYREYKKYSLPLFEITNIFKYIVRREQHRSIFSKYGDELAAYSGASLDRLQQDLRSLDSELRGATKDRLKYDIWQKADMQRAPSGVTQGKVRDKTERSLIDHISAKPNSRITLRQLFHQATDTLPRLKPCMLMSPLSVSQLLPLQNLFDVVVIDEASQMKPEVSIPSIARADQAVIVGDPNQLPPSSQFLSKQASSEDEEEDFSDESILDMALTVLQNPRELLWHYRSRHEDLIRFSNSEFYGNKLMIPVTSNPNELGKGITYKFIKEGVYQARSAASAGQKGGVNEIEARKMIESIIEFMNSRQSESLGVVLMNINQMELVRNLFDSAARKDAGVQTYLEKWSTQEEGVQEFFVKNLENVQGDERDVIMIGTVYGPNKNGDVHQRFNISGAHGWRRLNVLITRAKHEVVLFTSLPTHEIQDSDERSRQVFKKYLEYANTKILAEGSKTDFPIDNPFQQWAIDQINSVDGFSADWEIGVAGYRIDIAVKHDEFAGWIMAVETDGATYHSSKSARDRDLLRQQILEGYDWHFHRIWSTDWINDPVGVKHKLVSALERRLEFLRTKTKVSESADLPINTTLNSGKASFNSPTAEHLAVTSIASPSFDSADADVPSEAASYDISEDESSEVGNIARASADQDLEASVKSRPYVISDLEQAIIPDPVNFYQPAYRPLLSKAIEYIIDHEGPVEYEVLIRRVRDAHGWAKAGSDIRSVIQSCVPDGITQTKFGEKRFFWPSGMSPSLYSCARYPNPSDNEAEIRKYDEVSPEEIAVIDVWCRYINDSNGSIQSPDSIAKNVSLYLGWKKCSAQATTYILKALIQAANKETISSKLNSYF